MASALTPPERNAFKHLWARADPEQTGVLVADQAIQFFAPTHLPSAVLGEIWAVADSDNVGFLTADGFATALRLIGHAQQGTPLSPALASRPAPPPVFDGIVYPDAPPPRSRSAAPPPPPARPPVAAPAPPPPRPPVAPAAPAADVITSEDKSRFARIFANSGPVGGLLDGEKAKNIFLKSRLPVDTLGAIWGLADSGDRGALDLTDFTIAMHYIQGSMNGTIPQIPASVPPTLYQQAGGDTSGPHRSFTPAYPPAPAFNPASPGAPSRTPTGFSGAPIPAQYTGKPPPPPIPAQNTGGTPFGASQEPYPAPVPGLLSTGAAPPASVQSTENQPGVQLSSPHPAPSSAPSGLLGNQSGSQSGAGTDAWDVTPAAFANANTFFDSMDNGKTGQLDGALVVPFFLQSKLDETTLARIWDLSDITQTGSLSREEFAVAMHLINTRLAGSEVPNSLPESLVPPSLRGQSVPAPPAHTEPQKDLLSLLDDDNPPPVSSQGAFVAPSAPTSGPGSVTASPRQPTGFEPTGSKHTGTNQSDRSTVPAGSTFPDNPFDQPPPTTFHTFGNAPPPPPLPTGGASGPVASAERGAPSSTDAVFLQAAERELAKVKAQRQELESDLASSINSVKEMRERINRAKAEIESEQGAVDELQGKTQLEGDTLSQVQAQVNSEKAHLAELEQEKLDLQAQIDQDKTNIKVANRQASQAQTAATPVREEMDALRAESTQKADPSPGLVTAPLETTSESKPSTDTPPEPVGTQSGWNPFGAPPPLPTGATLRTGSVQRDTFGVAPETSVPNTADGADPTLKVPGGIPSFDDAFGDSFQSLSLHDTGPPGATAAALEAATRSEQTEHPVPSTRPDFEQQAPGTQAPDDLQTSEPGHVNFSQAPSVDEHHAHFSISHISSQLPISNTTHLDHADLDTNAPVSLSGARADSNSGNGVKPNARIHVCVPPGDPLQANPRALQLANTTSSAGAPAERPTSNRGSDVNKSFEPLIPGTLAFESDTYLNSPFAVASGSAGAHSVDTLQDQDYVLAERPAPSPVPAPLTGSVVTASRSEHLHSPSVPGPFASATASAAQGHLSEDADRIVDDDWTLTRPPA